MVCGIVAISWETTAHAPAGRRREASLTSKLALALGRTLRRRLIHSFRGFWRRQKHIESNDANGSSVQRECFINGHTAAESTAVSH
jgi:hypothetical protein